MATAAATLMPKLPPNLKRCATIASELRSSIWLTALPLEQHGFALSKGDFRDAIRLSYGWDLDGVPTTCICGHAFTSDHALSCPTGDYPSICHNHVRDLLVNLMREVCTDVSTEPHLQLLTGEVFDRASTNTTDEARLDIRARGFWECRVATLSRAKIRKYLQEICTGKSSVVHLKVRADLSTMLKVWCKNSIVKWWKEEVENRCLSRGHAAAEQ